MFKANVTGDEKYLGTNIDDKLLVEKYWGNVDTPQ